MAKKNQRSKGKKRFLSFPFFWILIIALAIPLTLFLLQKRTDTRTRAAGHDAPNIIVIMTDDQRYDEMETLPAVTERMASRGATFTNAMISNPICCPSRA